MKENNNFIYRDKSKVSKAQIEVWEMKDSLYQRVKHLSLQDALLEILRHSKEITDSFIKGRNLQ